jgi:hypothetical protein
MIIGEPLFSYPTDPVGLSGDPTPLGVIFFSSFLGG